MFPTGPDGEVVGARWSPNADSPAAYQHSRHLRQATHRRDSGPILRKRGRKFATGPWSTTPRMSVLVKAATENTEGTEQQVILALNAGDLYLLKNGSKRFKC